MHSIDKPHFYGISLSHAAAWAEICPSITAQGDIMEISKNNNSITVYLDENELGELGLSYEALQGRELTAVIFLAALRAQLTAEGVGDIYGDIRVSRHDGGIMLTMNVSVSPEYFSCPAEVISRCHTIKNDCALYGTGSGYALVPEGCDPVEAAIIKEHGRLICDAPLKRLYPLNYM